MTEIKFGHANNNENLHYKALADLNSAIICNDLYVLLHYKNRAW